MNTQRLNVRLEATHRQKLEELAEAEGISISEVVRELIERAYRERDHARRLAAAERLVAMELDDVPDPDELSKQLAAKYDFERIS